MKGVSWVLGLVLLSFLCAVAVGLQQQQKEDQSTTAAGNVQDAAVPEAKTATEFAKVKPNNYPNFAFRTSQDASKESEAVKDQSSSSVVTASSFQNVPENKPNNYPNFEFRTSEDASKEVAKDQSSSSAVTASSFENVPENKPNNYPNFEFRTSKDASKEGVKDQSSSSAVTASSFQSVPENKPNNYPNFEFRTSDEQTARTTTTAVPDFTTTFYRGSDASRKYPSSFDLTNARHQAEVRGQDSTQGASQFTSNTRESFSMSSVVKTPVSTTTASSTYRGSDPYGRHPSSFDLTNARRQAQPQNAQSTQQFSTRDSFTSKTPSSSLSTYRGSDASGRYPSSFDLTNARYQAPHSQELPQFSTQNSIPFESSSASTTFHRGSDPSGMYPSSFDLTNARHQASYVYNAEQQTTNQFTSTGKVFGDDSSAYRFNGGNKYSTTTQEQSAADQTTTASFATNFAHESTREFTSGDSKTSFGTTSPAAVVAASSHELHPSSTAAATSAGEGCSSSYWSSHTSNWPSFFTINSKVTEAFPGSKVAIVYGTTTLLQALYDTRPDGYSQLLSHGVAALLNAYEKPSSYEYSHAAVVELFTNALASRTSAAQQALKFQNANTAYGTEGCNA